MEFSGNKDRPFFSIIVPTKNRNDLLREALDSILQQEFEDFEVLVVDDHSETSVSIVLEEIANPRFNYFQSEGTGKSCARNTGLKMAKGKYICFVDDDDFVSNLYLFDFYYALAKYDFPEKIVFRTNMIYTWKHKTKKATDVYDEKKFINAMDFALRAFCSSCTICIPSEISKSIKFPEGVTQWQDAHYLMRLFNECGLIQLNSWNYHYRQHELMGTSMIMDRGRLEEEAKVHVSYIDDFFDAYGNMDPKVFTIVAKSKLTSEKYLEYANRGLLIKDTSTAYKVLWLSIKRGIFLRNWKRYGVFLRDQFKLIIHRNRP